MAEIFINYVPGAAYTTNDLKGNTWILQTITPAENFVITGVYIFAKRDAGTAGTLTVHIRATSGGKPTGGDLCSGSISGEAITTDGDGALFYCPIVGGIELQSGVQYALIGSNSSGSVDINWRGHTAGYAGGSFGYSLNAGSSWSTNASYDCQFQVLGEGAGAGGQGGPAGLLVAHGVI